MRKALHHLLTLSPRDRKPKHRALGRRPLLSESFTAWVRTL